MSDSKISCLFALFDVTQQDREKAILICFCWAYEEGKLKRLVYSYVQTDVTEIVIWNTKIFKEIFPFLFFLFVSKLYCYLKECDFTFFFRLQLLACLKIDLQEVHFEEFI